MKSIKDKLHKIEFEYRIFVSLLIVVLVLFLSYFVFEDRVSIAAKIGALLNFSEYRSNIVWYSLMVILIFFVSLLRMWAGSVLTSKRVMSFKIQNDAFITEGPYLLVRNPIYLADWLAMLGFAFCLPLSGLLLPILFYLHYNRLIDYEERYLAKNFSYAYKNYVDNTPRLIPTLGSLSKFWNSTTKINITKDGFRHNSLYILFIPGFISAIFLNDFLYAVLIGFPGVIDWAFVHTIIGAKRKNKDKHPKRKKVFENVLYANCWEDPQLDRLALNIKNDDVVFTITSGGCNALAFLLDNPAEIISLDLNSSQNYLLELKIAAFKNLAYEQLLEFFGVRNSSNRLKYYDAIKKDLSKCAFDYWDANKKKISDGIIHCGRYEKYMRLLRKCLDLLIGNKTILKFFNSDQDKREELFEKKWNNLRWKIFTKILLSRKTMSLLFDKAFFKYLDKSFSFSSHFAIKAKYALTELPVKENYFLSYILLGKYFNEQNLPVYIREKNFNYIKNRLNRIKIFTDTCENFFKNIPAVSISKFNFTNIFEWMSPESFENLLRETVRVAKDGAILTYRNLLVKREHSNSLDYCIKSKRTIAALLHEQDLSFIYNNYVVEEIFKGETLWNTKLAKSLKEVN